MNGGRLAPGAKRVPDMRLHGGENRSGNCIAWALSLTKPFLAPLEVAASGVKLSALFLFRSRDVLHDWACFRWTQRFVS